MKTFPMFLRMDNRHVIVLGGGEQAAQKTRLILKTDAKITVIAPELDPELQGLVDQKRITHVTAPVTVDSLRGAALVFAASGCAGADAAHAVLANIAGVVLNVVDAPDLCDAFTPSIVDRDPVVVAIGTEGTAPVLGRQIKTQIEAMLEPRLGVFAALAGTLRGSVAQHVAQDQRRPFWRWVFDELRMVHASGAERDAVKQLKTAIAEGGVVAASTGSVSLVGAGPGAPDLITLRGVKRLQEADVILYDRLAGTDVLELARRDAERVDVGKMPGDAGKPEAWSQPRINRLIVQLAQEGKSVVRLKCGDPGVFGRAAEELEACRAAGIPVELVPGVTSASAAAAQFGDCLTERGAVDTLILSTARAQKTGDAHVGAAAQLRPGTQLALYMAVAKIEELEAELLAQAPANLPCIIVEGAERHDTRRVTCALSDLAATVRRENIQHPAMIFVKYPMHLAADVTLTQTA